MYHYPKEKACPLQEEEGIDFHNKVKVNIMSLKLNLMQEYLFRLQDYFFYQLLGALTDSDPYARILLRE